MCRIYFKSFIVALGIVFALTGITPLSVNAQETKTDEFTLEEITITAEKHTSDLQKTAISLSAVTGDEVREKAITSIDSLLMDVPGVEVGGFQTGKMLFIRGVGSNVSPYLDNDPSNALMLDGVYSGKAEAVMGAVYDISRVEVLRGPQGTLYGRNAIGGTVNLISNAPSDKFEAIGNIQMGDYNLKHFDGSINTPISDKMAMRIALLRETRDGYLSGGTENADKLSFRAKLSYKPTDKISFLATIERNEDNSDGQDTVPVPGSAGHLSAFGWVSGFDYTKGWVVPVGADAWTNDEWHTSDSTLYNQIFNTYTLQMDLDLGWGQLTLLPSYSDSLMTIWGGSSADAQAASQAISKRTQKQWSGEARLASKEDSTFKWLLGYYMQTYKNADLSSSTTLTLSTTANALSWATYREPGGTQAIFGQATYPVTEKFRLTAGMRYNIDNRKMNYRFGYGNLTDTANAYYDQAALVDGLLQYDSGLRHYKSDLNSFTYKAGIEYDLSESSMLYTQVSTGIKSGGLNTGAPPTTYDPEKLTAYEIGSKNRFLNNQLQVNTEAYYYDYDNMQQTIRTITYVAGVQNYASQILGAGPTHFYGGEVETDYMLTLNDRVKTSLTYMHAEYGDLTLPISPFGTYSAVTPLKGTQASKSPKWVGTLEYQHSWLLDDGAGISASIDTRLSSGFFVTIEKYLPGSWQKGYHRSNTHVTYSSASGKWSTGVWIKNIENEAQTTMVMPNYRRMITDPRTFGMTLSVKY